MIRSDAITTSIPINFETGMAVVGPQDFCGMFVGSLDSTSGSAFKQIFTMHDASGRTPLRIQYQSSTDRLQIRVQDAAGGEIVVQSHSAGLGHVVDSILLGGFSYDFSANQIDVYAQIIGGTKRVGTATNSNFGLIQIPTGATLFKGPASASAYLGKVAVALASGTLSEAEFDDIYTEFSTSPMWGALKELASMKTVDWHLGFSHTTGSGD